MKRTTVISAKIKPEYAKLIQRGIKHYEIRTEPFGDAQAIRYINSVTGEELGTYRIKFSYRVNRDNDSRLIQLSAISDEEFHSLFPPMTQGGPKNFWIAEIGAPVTIEELLKEDDYVNRSR